MVAAVTTTDQALSATVVTDVVERVAATPGTRARLAGYLLEHPDALTTVTHARPSEFAAHRVRDQAAEAARFLAWLRERRRPLAQATQGDLDTWLTIRPQARRRLPGFVRWRQTRGLLLLLYAQPAARITRLTRANIEVDEHEVRLRLGEDHVLLPPPLGELIQRLPEQTPAGMARNLVDGDRWLFPGRRPGHPMSSTTMSTRLRNLGIEPRAARNTALLQLGAELPSLVLADLLGVHINTAERWNAAAGARWAGYVAHAP
jgi:hypothetical protein